MAVGHCLKFQLSTYKKTMLSRFWLLNRRNKGARLCRRYSSDVKGVFKVLYLNSSGCDNRSFTGQTANEFLAKYRALHPEHLIEEVHLWDKKLLSFGLSHVEGKMRLNSGKETAHDKLKLLAVEEMTSQLLAANKVIISCPMWNYSVPYVLKQYIDCVVQSDLTFSDTVNGTEGLVTGRPLLLITSSSSDFSSEPMKSLDFQVPYLKAIFGFIGFRDFRHIYIGNTKHIRREELMKYAKQRIEEEVDRF
jgi:FMN-dependent NADH-azoreductase